MMRVVPALRRLARLALVAAAAMGSAPVASALCTTRSVTGAVSVTRCDGYAVATIDLVAGDVALRGARSSERGRTATEWSDGVDGAVLAFPGGPFSFPSFTPEGLTVGAGEHWSETRDDGRFAVLGFDNRGVGVFVPADRAVPAEPWQETVVSGPPLVRDGVVSSPCAGTGCASVPRTGLGLTADGRRLIVVVAEGATDPELGQWLVEAGAFGALRSGEGATSVLWDGVADEWIVPSSDGAGREGGPWLAAVDRSTGERFRMRGVVGVAGDPERFLADASLTVETLAGDVVASGAPITEGGYWEFSLPVREYVVRASREGFRTGCKICVGVPSEDAWCSLFLTAGSGAETCAAPPRSLEVGPYPEANDPPRVSPDAGVESPTPSGCAAAGGYPGGGFGLLLLAGALVVGRYGRSGRR